jgi:hypothetical protein
MVKIGKPQWQKVGNIRSNHICFERRRKHNEGLKSEPCKPKNRAKEDKKGPRTFLQIEIKIFSESYSLWI